MIIQMYIGGCLVEELPLRLEGCKCYEQRYDVIFRTKGWLKHKYRVSITILDNWEIVLKADSKFQLPNGKKY